MRFPPRSAAALAAVLVFVAGCQGDPGTPSTPGSSTATPSATVQTTSSPAPAAFDGRVNLREYNATCAVPSEFCWLPTQFDARIVAGQTVAKRRQWPVQDDVVRVVCETPGMPYRDGAGEEHTDWFGIVVPRDKLESRPGTNRKPTQVDGESVAFVQASWIAGAEGKQLPECKSLIK